MTITIDSDIPLPDTSPGKGNPYGRPRVYPFDQMEVGDSFFAPTGDRGRGWLRALARQYEQDHGGAFRVLPWIEGDAEGFRCWRIA